MKKIRQFVNLLLSAVIVTLGFGSCVSQQKYQAAQEEIRNLQELNGALRAETDALRAENDRLQQNLNKAMEYQRKIEQRKVVYGPPPTSYQRDITRDPQE